MFSRRKREQDLDRELRDHLELEAQEQDRRPIGNLTLIKEDVRQAWGWTWLDRLAQDIRYTGRILRRSPGFSVVAVLSLALGIGANTAIFSLIDAVRLRTLPVPKPRQLARIQILGGNRGFILRDPSALTYPLFEEIRDHQQAFSGVFAWSIDSFLIGEGMQTRIVPGLLVSGGFFNGLGVAAVAGRLLSNEDDVSGCAAPGIVLSYGMWQSEFGARESAIGSRLTVLGHSLEVIGVAPPSFSGVDVGKRFDIALPICAQRILGQGTRSIARRDVFWLSVMARLKPGWTVAQAAHHLQAISPALMENTLPSGYAAQSMARYRDYRLEAIPAPAGASDLRDRYETPLWLLLGITAMVLLIACANVANLTLARVSARRREFAARLALGASRARLLQQALIESGALALFGAAAGIALAQMVARTIVALLGTQDDPVSLNLNLDWRMLAFTAAVAFVACVLFALAPALQGVRIQPGVALQSAGRGPAGGRSRFYTQRLLLVAQMSLSCVLLVGALLFVRGFRNLVTFNPGFREQGVLLGNVNAMQLRLAPAAVLPVQRQILDEVRSVPGVAAVATTTNTLLHGSSWSLVVRAGDTLRDARFTWVSPGYFDTLEIPILAGRDFNETDRQDSPPVAIVNQTFVRRFFPNTNPIGKTFRTLAEPNYPAVECQIVGVSKDTKYADLREEIPGMVYAPASQYPTPGPWLNLYIRSSEPLARVASAIKQRLGENHPQLVAGFSVYQEQIQSGLTRERLLAALSGFFGVLATILAAVGLYGVVAYIVVQRRAEIGIRMALGAGRWRVIAMVMHEIALLLAAGIAVGAAGALALGRSAQSLLFGLSAHDPATFAIAVAVLAVVAALGSFPPARLAAKVDPMVTLRCE
jgi:predicted permease